MQVREARKVLFEERETSSLELTTVRESSKKWASKGGKRGAEKTRPQPRKVELVQSKEGTISERRHDKRWEPLSTGGRRPAQTDEVLASLLSAAAVSTAATLANVVSDTESEPALTIA